MKIKKSELTKIIASEVEKVLSYKDNKKLSYNVKFCKKLQYLIEKLKYKEFSKDYPLKVLNVEVVPSILDKKGYIAILLETIPNISTFIKFIKELNKVISKYGVVSKDTNMRTSLDKVMDKKEQLYYNTKLLYAVYFYIDDIDNYTIRLTPFLPRFEKRFKGLKRFKIPRNI